MQVKLYILNSQKAFFSLHRTSLRFKIIFTKPMSLNSIDEALYPNLYRPNLTQKIVQTKLIRQTKPYMLNCTE